ncbi:ArdC family protein [Roseiconus nitratireducens]|nr:zincin-like metallopeptidase domain-containing protein [Roseiconus nitratireducens]
MRSQNDIRQDITNSIIESLSNGSLPPWRKPWSDDPNSPGLHTSLSTGAVYRGINQLILQCSAAKQNFQSKWWGTFKQIQFNGASVRKGQKATKIVLWKPIKRSRIDENGKETDDSFMVMREFSVFNAEQTTGLDQFRVGHTKPNLDSEIRYQHADEVIEATGATINYGGNRAFYRRSDDTITMPFRHQFESPESFYETLLHELVHWGVTRSDFERKQTKETYAFEELVAELGASFLMGAFSISTTATTENSASYLKQWLSAMANDSTYIFKASALSSKVVDQHILSFSRDAEDAPEARNQPVLARSKSY